MGARRVSAGRCGASSVWPSGSPRARTRSGPRRGWPRAVPAPRAATRSACSTSVSSITRSPSDLLFLYCLHLRRLERVAGSRRFFRFLYNLKATRRDIVVVAVGFLSAVNIFMYTQCKSKILR